ncbi:MAG TPA: DUF2877 domain-containing protein [Solirubrobacteraceae bacterium]|nr:DUF2877 domain-containing protein [Solirubrobacteraceae bacterium]
MSGARAVFAGPGARRALVEGARGQVELVLNGGGGYVRLGSSDWLLLTRPGAPFGPLSLAVDGLDGLGLLPGTPARVTGDRLLVGDRPVSLERMRLRPCVGAGVATVAVGAPLPNPPALLEHGIAALAGARVTDAVRLLAGLGDGLTPAGDDVLAGYAAARVALGAPVAISPWASGRSSPIGLAYLRCAERGELPERLRAWGSSSGTAIAWGMNAAVFQSTERSYRCPDSDWGSTYSRTRRSSISPRPTASGRWHGGMTRSSMRS